MSQEILEKNKTQTPTPLFTIQPIQSPPLLTQTQDLSSFNYSAKILSESGSNPNVSTLSKPSEPIKQNIVLVPVKEDPNTVKKKFVNDFPEMVDDWDMW